jgi:hypothetical protein
MILIPFGMMEVSEATAASSPLIATVGSETMMEGKTVMMPPIKIIMHGKSVLMPAVHSRCHPANHK